MQNAELPDQSWMSPEVPAKRPVAEYSDFNPAPESPSQREYNRLMREAGRHLVIAIICFAVLAYMLIH